MLEIYMEKVRHFYFVNIAADLIFTIDKEGSRTPALTASQHFTEFTL